MSNLNEMQNDPGKWKGGVFYVNKSDKRVFVPKPNPVFGWTLNFGSRNTWLFLSVVFIAVLLTIIFA